MDNKTQPEDVVISYLSIKVQGRFSRDARESSSPIWQRLAARLAAEDDCVSVGDYVFEMPWPLALEILREFGSRIIQSNLNFRFKPDDSAKPLIQRFSEEVRVARESRGKLAAKLGIEEIEETLREKGFKRKLKPFQLRDLQHLLTLPNGANFSVPGAGKTTVTFALHLMTQKQGQHLLIICPKAAFAAWRGIVNECMNSNPPSEGHEQFTFLEGDEETNDRLLRSGQTRFVLSYDLMVRQQNTIANYLARQPVHLVLDEAHRMKAGSSSQRGAYLLKVATLPIRRDILTGTPMPQGSSDLAAQLNFLWPGQGLELEISRGAQPRDVLGELFVRTTKSELGLTKPNRFYHQVDMAPAQLALYSIARNESLRQLTQTLKRGSDFDFIAARRSVMRLLQLSVNPTLALRSMAASGASLDTRLVDKVFEEGASAKMQAVALHARRLASEGRKVVIWTIFTGLHPLY